VIDQVRILKPIRVQSEGIHSVGPGGGPLSISTYLADVAYQIRAHFERSRSRTEAAGEWEKDEALSMGYGAPERCGRREVFLGDRECLGYVQPCIFGEGEGAYDNVNEMDFGLMVHSIGGPDEANDDFFEVRLWRPKMFFGVISFPRPEDCTAVKKIQKKKEEPAGSGKDSLRRPGFGVAAEEGGGA
jgi:CRISPR-associated protein Cas5d